MVGKKPVDKATKGLNALVDEFTAAVKELVNAGEETVVHMAVGSSRVISAVVDATGTVTKVAVETVYAEDKAYSKTASLPLTFFTVLFIVCEGATL